MSEKICSYQVCIHIYTYVPVLVCIPLKHVYYTVSQVYQFPAKHPCSHVFEAQRHSTSSCTRQTKETATAVDGDGGSDSDSDDDVIPPYLPPLPKKEINEDGEIWSIMVALTLLSKKLHVTLEEVMV